MRKMLLSFKPDVYNKIYTGIKIFEHRRNFPEVRAYAKSLFKSRMVKRRTQGVGINSIKRNL